MRSPYASHAPCYYAFHLQRGHINESSSSRSARSIIIPFGFLGARTAQLSPFCATSARSVTIVDEILEAHFVGLGTKGVTRGIHLGTLRLYSA